MNVLLNENLYFLSPVRKLCFKYFLLLLSDDVLHEVPLRNSIDHQNVQQCSAVQYSHTQGKIKLTIIITSL